METPAPSNGSVVIPADTVTFALTNGQSFTVRLSEFAKEVGELWKSFEGKTHWDYCQAIIDRVSQLNPGVVLSLGEADWLAEEVGALFAKKKRERREYIDKSLKSAFSME